MSSALSILNRKPNIKFVAPRSGITIPEVQKSTVALTPNEVRIKQLIQSLTNVAAAAEAVEKIVSARVKTEVLKLDLRNPEDAVVAQAAARQYPDKAKTINGFSYVDEITFDMYSNCLQQMKQAGIAAGQKQQTKAPESFKADRTDFGGRGKDSRPDINQATIPFAPIDIAAFIAAGIPLLFSMLFPLINVAIKKDIVGHTHPVIVPPAVVPVPTAIGIPMFP